MIRDIGNLKRQLGRGRAGGGPRLTPKNTASHYLAYQMGWAPLISDLRKLLTFQADVDKKLRELKNLYDGDGLQRRVRLKDWKATTSVTAFSNFPLDSSISSTARVNVVRYSTIERWGTVRWFPSALPDPRFSSKQLGSLARKLTYGINGISAKQVWDAIPWTWLIGWFSNADDFLQAHSNTIPLTHSTPCVMTKIETKTEWTRSDPQPHWAKGGYGSAGLSSKERTTSAGTLSATLPFLNRRQISILGALAIQRKR